MRFGIKDPFVEGYQFFMCEQKVCVLQSGRVSVVSWNPETLSFPETYVSAKKKLPRARKEDTSGE